MPHMQSARTRNAQAGFTLTEVMVASGVGLMVITAVLSAFVWCGRQATLCAKIAWSQDEAMRTCSKLTAYVRNAREVVSIDTNDFAWVRLRMADNSIVRLSYSNSIAHVRDGRLYLERTNTTETLVARGLTKIMDSNGFNQWPVFSVDQTKASTNMLRIAFRVSEPVAGGVRSVDDSQFAATVKFAVRLRNAADET